MKTIILPGYSEHNKDWAMDLAGKLNLGHRVAVIEWEHWSTGGSFSAKKEIEKILKVVGAEKVNVVAKSVGVAVGLEVVPRISSQINKVILCGIASVANEDRKDLLKAFLSNVPVEKILCIQNEKDKFVPYKEAEKFYHSVSPEIKIISKPRSDHDYPYTEDFQKFLED